MRVDPRFLVVGPWLALASCSSTVVERNAGGVGGASSSTASTTTSTSASTSTTASSSSSAGTGGASGTGGAAAGCTTAADCAAGQICVSYFCGAPPCSSPAAACKPDPCPGAMLDCSCGDAGICTGYLGCDAYPDAGALFCWNGG